MNDADFRSLRSSLLQRPGYVFQCESHSAAEMVVHAQVTADFSAWKRENGPDGATARQAAMCRNFGKPGRSR